MRCPNCRSLETKRVGKTQRSPVGPRGRLKPLQRFLCRTCGKSFTNRRPTAHPGAVFSDDVMIDAVRLYVQALTSYRVLAELLSHRLGRTISPKTLNSWVAQLGHIALTPLEVSALLTPRWGGFLGVDGKAIWVAGQELCLMLAVDHPTQDIVHALLVPAETSDAYVRLLTEAIADAGYPVKGVTCDFGPGFLRSHRDYFGQLPFQACRVHLDRRLDKHIPKAKGSPDAALRDELRDRLRSVAYAPSEDQAKVRFAQLLADRNRFGHHGQFGPIRHLERYFDNYVTHFRIPGMPADNNVTENVIKQLSKKLRLMEGFQTPDSAESFIRLLIGCYRFKKFTDSARSSQNGRSPLELAGVELNGLDWLSFLLGTTPPGRPNRTH